MRARRSGASLSRAEARRIAIAAQGFVEPRPSGRIDRRHVRRVFERVHVVQIDSVNVFARAHEIAVHARLGAHPRSLLAAMAHDRELVEYWGHEASLLPSRLHPLFRWRMRFAREGKTMWLGLRRFAREQGRYLDRVLDEVRDRGPLTARELSAAGERHGPWWGWSPAKRALVELAAGALGIATVRDLADYFRLDAASARVAAQELVDAGLLVPVHVEGAPAPELLHRDARVPTARAAAAACAILSPFDSLVWSRSRTERLFDFHYRLEFYTPPAQRRFGYYVVPFLLGDRLAARVDLGADRAQGALLVKRVAAEPSCRDSSIVEPLRAELGALGRWLGLNQLVVCERSALGRAISAPASVDRSAP
jgi:uncharacterized protein YcaQ